MGRGLSNLQKCILVTALKRPDITVSSQEDVRVAAQSRALGLDMPIGKVGDEQGVHIRTATIHRAFYGRKVPRTNATRVAISKALYRLADRGLVTIWVGKYSNWTGANLTEEGKAEAKRIKKLTANMGRI